MYISLKLYNLVSFLSHINKWCIPGGKWALFVKVTLQSCFGSHTEQGQDVGYRFLINQSLTFLKQAFELHVQSEK